MVSGALAGGIAAAITTPLDVCKTLLNTQEGLKSKTTGLVEAIKTVYRVGGPGAYFKGLYSKINYCNSTMEAFICIILGIL